MIRMADPQAELLESFQAFLRQAEAGASVPTVHEHDLVILHDLCVERAKRYCGKDGVLSLDSMARACAPGANLPAVWLRHTQLRALYREGRLVEWQDGTSLDPIVFQVAATFPMHGVRFDQDTFVQQLRNTSTRNRSSKDSAIDVR